MFSLIITIVDPSSHLSPLQILRRSPKFESFSRLILERGRKMNPLSKKIYLYNVTMGLYMLDCNFSADFMVGKKFSTAGVIPT
ncbi:Small subunit of serine palmitoyltransferase-like protein [Dioscorea alata]|uniref:Small subunit of serine palmitoyltransferase-like protein n=1 Tax=Dioscorea alata TaxID=55571 RepID=A0ACB7UPL2_DIOAL|nr:Small subunit of serine palmitoyltransferase-like protein [Dioscorea alata]